MLGQKNRLSLLLGITLLSGCLLPALGKESKRSIDLSTLNKLIKEHKFILAEDEIQNLLKSHPGIPEAHYAYGNLLRTTGQIDQAKDEFNRARELDPKDTKPLVALAEICLNNMELDQSMSYAQKAIALDPDSLNARAVLIAILLKSERTNEAERQLHSLLQEKKPTPELDFLAYKLNLQKGAYRKARYYLEAILAKSDNQTPELLLELAKVYAATGDYEKSRDTLELLTSTNPLLNEARLRLAHSLEGHFHNYQAAQEQYKEVLRMDPLSIEAIAGIQRCQNRQRNIALRLKTALREELSKLFPDKPKH